MSKHNGRTYRIEVAEVDYRGKRAQERIPHKEVSNKLSEWLRDRGLMNGFRERQLKPETSK